MDTLLEARGKELSKTFYTQVAETGNKGILSLINPKDGNALLITRDSVAFTKDAYLSGHVNLDEAFGEFQKVWSVIQRVLKLTGIRRIGMVAEHRLDSATNNNIELLKSLTKLSGKEAPANVMLHFENRTPSKLGEKINIATSGFTNAIYDFYDSALDSTAATDGKINANFDYQKYYAPALDTKVAEEMEAHFFAFKKELKHFDAELVKLGLKK